MSKKIDGHAFRAAESAAWEDWKSLFEQVSPESFTSQKLYQINPVRRKYRLAIAPPPEKTEGPKPVTKPIFKPKMK